MDMKRKHYTQNEIEFIKENAETMSFAEIARRMGRPRKGLSWKARQLGFFKIYQTECENTESTDGEVWKDIEGFEGLYMVSSLGNVRRLCKNGVFSRTERPNLLKQTKNLYGYKMVNLCNGKIRKSVGVHILVANAFVENPDNLPQVNHKDENKENNCADNLEFVTAKQNMTYNGLSLRRAKKRSINVLQCNENLEVVAEYENARYAGEAVGVSGDTIRKHCIGMYKGPCKGYYWKYKDENKNPVRPVLQYDIDGNFIERFNSCAEAGRKVGGNSTSIKYCCYGIQKTAHGFIWRYETDVKQEQQKNEQQD